MVAEYKINIQNCAEVSGLPQEKEKKKKEPRAKSHTLHILYKNEFKIDHRHM